MANKKKPVISSRQFCFFRKMRALTSRKIILSFVVLFTGFTLCASTIANIRERRENALVIDKGRLDGVRLRMKGTARGSLHGIDHLNVARFVVSKVEEKSSEVSLEEIGVGFNSGHITYVVFDEELKPLAAPKADPAPVVRPDPPPVKSEETRTAPVEVAADPLREGRDKAKRSWQNDSGYWEAEFHNETIMVFIPGGDFTIGSPARDSEPDERPQHRAEISSFWIGKHETSFAQFDAFCAETGRSKPDDSGWGRNKLPVINISWHDAVAYAEWLSGKTGLRFRLPSEAEWEKAARERYPWGSQQPNRNLANFNDFYARTTPITSFAQGASRYGLFNMAGNVWEWTGDWYAADYYQRAPLRDPRGPESGTEKVVRGGSWRSSASDIRSARRGKTTPDDKRHHLGFRLAMDTR